MKLPTSYYIQSPISANIVPISQLTESRSSWLGPSPPLLSICTSPFATALRHAPLHAAVVQPGQLLCNFLAAERNAASCDRCKLDFSSALITDISSGCHSCRTDFPWSMPRNVGL